MLARKTDGKGGCPGSSCAHRRRDEARVQSTAEKSAHGNVRQHLALDGIHKGFRQIVCPGLPRRWLRSEEHTSELQSQSNLVCRLLLEKKKTIDRPSSP